MFSIERQYPQRNRYTTPPQTGIPVITSNIGGMVELVEDGIDGFTFEAGNKDALKDVMKTIEENPKILNGLIVSGEKIRSIQDNVRFIQEIYRKVL